MKNYIGIAVIGAGRAAELHLEAYGHVSGIKIKYRIVVSKTMDKLKKFAEKNSFELYSQNIEDAISDSEVDIIDICTPPYLHTDIIKKAVKAGKHIICEKPLSPYFGREHDSYPIGKTVSKHTMYLELMKELEEIKELLVDSDSKFMYAENFVYAPSILKAAEIVRAKKNKIMFIKGEESLKGSSSPVAGEWNKTGGGTLIRTGTHPLSAILWLKKQEALTKNININVKSVFADTATLTCELNDYEHRYIKANPKDVEDFGCIIITFSDNTKGLAIATDTLLGGSRNYVELYCNDAALMCNLTMNDNMKTYLLDEEGMDDVYISEMLPSKLGWNYPFISDEVLRGYANEMQDFIECVYYDREPKAGFELAYDTMKVLYAAYYSAEIGEKVEL